MREMMNTNGKLFAAPTQLLPALGDTQVADPFRLRSLSGRSLNVLPDIVGLNRASLLTVSFTSFADPMVESFRLPFLQQRPSDTQLIDLRPIPNMLKYAVWAPFVRRAALKSVPEGLQDTYFVYRGGKELRAMLGVPNLFGGYAFVLDRTGRVRWRASGFATEQELDTMFQVLKQL